MDGGLLRRAPRPHPQEHPAERDVGESQVIVSLRNGSRAIGGLAGEVLAWLERRGGGLAVLPLPGRSSVHCGRFIDRLIRMDARQPEVQPPDTAGG